MSSTESTTDTSITVSESAPAPILLPPDLAPIAASLHVAAAELLAPELLRPASPPRYSRRRTTPIGSQS